ncbi:MAG: hypothetical protein WC213_05655 [Arenimonas sp.]|jgi:hypothetical protein
MTAPVPLQRNGSAMLLLIVAGALQSCSAQAPADPESEVPAEATVSPATPTAEPSAPATTQTAASPAPVPIEDLPTPVATTPVATPIEPAPARVVTTPPAPRPPQTAPAYDRPEPVSIAIYMLSRGRGVPERTRAVYNEIQALLKEQQGTSVVTDVTVKRIGLEGETRLCAEFRDRTEARDTLERIRKLSAGVELLNVVEEPCTQSKETKP